jgi:hypothetical protein
MSKEAAMAILTGQPVPAPTAEAQVSAQTDAQVVGAEKPVDAPKDLDSARFAAQAKKEAEYVKKMEAYKKERDEWLKDKRESDEVKERAKRFEETRKTNPVEALKMIGFSEQDIFNFLAAQEENKPTPEQAAVSAATKTAEQIVKEQIDALKKEQADKEAAQVKERDDKLLASFKTDLGTVMASDKDKYEYCNHFGNIASDLAYELTIKIVEDSKGEDIPTAEEAMQMVEEHYEEQDKAMSQLKKRQPKVETQQVEAPKAPERTRTVSTPAGHNPPPPAIQKTRTLTNQATPTARALSSRINETKEQKRERLMQALRNGKLE